VIRDTIRPWPARAYRDTFALSEAPIADDQRGELPPGWTGLYFLPDLRLGDLRPDGTPRDDGVTPDIALPRRMFAGEDIEFHRPVHYGETLELVTTLGSVTEKTGRSGPLVFVTVDKVVGAPGDPALTLHWHDVFLEAPAADAPPPAPVPGPSDGEWEESLVIGATQLFRFSALTYNSHRIHYDRQWAREVEGYPDLLVHGPLVELLLLDAGRRHTPGRVLSRFSMKAIAPVFVDTPIRLVGTGDRVWAVDAAGNDLMHADFTWA
jgi:3-methylfumaryl-CoA hydratase